MGAALRLALFLAVASCGSGMGPADSDAGALDAGLGDGAPQLDASVDADGSGALDGSVDEDADPADGDAVADASPDCESAISGYPITTAEALARPGVIVVTGLADAPYRADAVADDQTFDFRTWSSVAFPVPNNYPFRIGRPDPGARTVVVGGRVVGQQSRELAWREMKRDHDGTGALVYATSDGDWLIVDGARYDNMMDDLRPRAASRFVFRNIWSRYTRDDVIENDEVRGGLVHDCLFEGAYMFLSEQNGSWDGRYELEISHVLARLEPMPYDTDVGGDPPVAGSLVDGRGHGQLFKHFGDPTPLYVHDSIFFVSQLSVNGAASMRFPEDAVWEDVTLIYAGGGAYPAPVPSGVTELNLEDYSREELEQVWDDAVTTWRRRHGVTSFDDVDMDRFIDPEPFCE